MGKMSNDNKNKLCYTYDHGDYKTRIVQRARSDSLIQNLTCNQEALILISGAT